MPSSRGGWSARWSGSRAGGGLRVLDAIFIRGDGETGELDAIAVHGDGADRIVAPLPDFRLDAARRRRSTERALWAIALEDPVARTGGTPMASDFVDATVLAESLPEQS